MIPSQGYWQNPAFCVFTHDFCNIFGYARNSTRILEYANGWVVQVVMLFELVVTIEFDIPAEAFELVNKARFNQANRTLVNTSFGL